MLLVSDGGPDQRLTYYSVQVSLLCVFLERNLDMLIAVRTCPYQSWQNIAERIMSTLNLGLQNVALARKEMPEEFEKLIANKSTLDAIRDVVTQNPNLKPQLLESVSQPITLLRKQFMALKIKEEKMNIREPAKDEEIVATFENIHMVDVNISAEQLRTEDLKDKVKLLNFMKTHCHCTPYIFQVKKCLNSDCSYCMNHPIQITPDQFASLHFLPLPLLDTSKAGCLSFEELYGKLTIRCR